jgi:hypothetical protein
MEDLPMKNRKLANAQEHASKRMNMPSIRQVFGKPGWQPKLTSAAALPSQNYERP